MLEPPFINYKSKSELNEFYLSTFKKTQRNFWVFSSKQQAFTAWNVSRYGVISGPYFPVLGLNTEIYEVHLCIQSEYRKIRTRNNFVFGHFSSNVLFDKITWNLKKYSAIVKILTIILLLLHSYALQISYSSNESDVSGKVWNFWIALSFILAWLGVLVLFYLPFERVTNLDFFMVSETCWT